MRRTEFDRQTELFEAVQQLAAVGGWEYDLHAETLSWTDEVRRIHDLPADYEPTVDEAIEFYHPADRPAVREVFETAIEDGEAFDAEWRLQTATGDQRWVRVQGKPQREAGETVRIQGAITDRTAQKQRQSRLETIIQHTPDALFVLDDDGRIIQANEQACESLGYECSGDPFDCSGLVGRHWSEIGTVLEDGNPTDADPLDSLREIPETVITVDCRHVRRDGSTFPVRVRTTRIDHDGDGEFLAIARDTSELAAQQRQLRRQNEQLDQFASVISHDLRSPLAVARSGVEVARRTEKTDESLERVSRAHDRMETLIDELLTLARNGGRMDDTDLEAVELSAITTRSWNTVSTEEAEIRVEGDTSFLADESRLRQLLENLFRNAVEHGLAGSRGQPSESGDQADTLMVRVGTLQDGFYIEDDGIGISEVDREAIFEAGYSTQTEGTGYGLEIVRTVADAHGWEITVTDAADGGARFEISGIDPVTSNG